MSWTLRHRGSPKEVAGLSVARIVEALRDGDFDTTDEVRGPRDTAWQVIEEHPQFAEIAAELEPEPVAREEDDGGVDMNALIDVTLVLLIFFILTTGYQVLEKVLQMPQTKTTDDSGVRTVRSEDVDNFMIRVRARQEQRQPRFWVGETEVPEAELEKNLTSQSSQNRKELILDADGVEYGTVIKVIDAAGGAGIDQVHFLMKKG
ncbi:MAG TPA: biopolymer transporter ExbD [Pirellulales bacterium]|jgi:biopolymer transport protein ExbD